MIHLDNVPENTSGEWRSDLQREGPQDRKACHHSDHSDHRGYHGSVLPDRDVRAHLSHAIWGWEQGHCCTTTPSPLGDSCSTGVLFSGFSCQVRAGSGGHSGLTLRGF